MAGREGDRRVFPPFWRVGGFSLPPPPTHAGIDRRDYRLALCRTKQLLTLPAQSSGESDSLEDLPVEDNEGQVGDTLQSQISSPVRVRSSNQRDLSQSSSSSPLKERDLKQNLPNVSINKQLYYSPKKLIGVNHRKSIRRKSYPCGEFCLQSLKSNRVIYGSCDNIQQRNSNLDVPAIVKSFNQKDQFSFLLNFRHSENHILKVSSLEDLFHYSKRTTFGNHLSFPACDNIHKRYSKSYDEIRKYVDCSVNNSASLLADKVGYGCDLATGEKFVRNKNCLSCNRSVMSASCDFCLLGKACGEGKIRSKFHTGHFDNKTQTSVLTDVNKDSQDDDWFSVSKLKGKSTVVHLQQPKNNSLVSPKEIITSSLYLDSNFLVCKNDIKDIVTSPPKRIEYSIEPEITKDSSSEKIKDQFTVDRLEVRNIKQKKDAVDEVLLIKESDKEFSPDGEWPKKFDENVCWPLQVKSSNDDSTCKYEELANETRVPPNTQRFNISSPSKDKWQHVLERNANNSDNNNSKLEPNEVFISEEHVLCSSFHTEGIDSQRVLESPRADCVNTSPNQPSTSAEVEERLTCSDYVEDCVYINVEPSSVNSDGSRLDYDDYSGGLFTKTEEEEDNEEDSAAHQLVDDIWLGDEDVDIAGNMRS